MSDNLETPSVKKSKAPLYISIGIVAALVLSYFFIPEVRNFFLKDWSVLTSGDEETDKAVGLTIWLVWSFGDRHHHDPANVPACHSHPFTYGGHHSGLWTCYWSFDPLYSNIPGFSFGYFIGRYFGPVIVEKLIGHKTEKKISNFIDDYGFWTVIVVRLSPFLSNDAISFVGGVLKMGYWKFIGATMIGISPLIIFIAYLGGDYERLKTGLIWTSIVSLILFFLFVWWDKKFRKK